MPKLGHPALWWQDPCKCTICSYECQLVAPVMLDQNEPETPMECPECGNKSFEIEEKA